MTETPDLEQIAAAFRHCAHNAYRLTLVGNASPFVREAFELMKSPRVGDWVVEVSTVGMKGRANLDAIGILEEIAQEKVVYDAPDFVWNEEEEGRPHPTETVHYIRTLDGRRVRWTNATIIAVIAERLR